MARPTTSTLLGCGISLVPALIGACATTSPGTGSDESGVTDIPQTGPRNQRETGNCWLYATGAWVESLETAANEREGRPPATHYSVAYWDYWDWFDKITGGKVHGSNAAGVAGDLDSGGSWGLAVELILERGLVHEVDFLSDAPLVDADAVTSAKAIVASSLVEGPLRTKAARADGALVRSELERAFQLGDRVSSALTAVFGQDGRETLLTSARAAGPVVDPDALRIVTPLASGPSEVHVLRDAIGARRGAGNDADKRTGTYAWSRVAFTAATSSSSEKTRAFFKRLQRALHAGAPVPIDWFWASPADPDHHGVFHRVTRVPDDDTDSVWHETLLYDYQVDVPGLGTLAAGTPASPAEESAALADDASIVFLRVKDSYYAYRTGTDRHAGRSDLYLDYLLGSVQSCTHDDSGRRSCEDIIPLDGAYLPPGF
jgi:hypothetical protein